MQVQDEVHVLDGRAANLVSTVGLVAGVLTVLGVAGYMASLVPFVVSFVVAVAAPLAWLAAVSRARLMPKG